MLVIESLGSRDAFEDEDEDAFEDEDEDAFEDEDEDAFEDEARSGDLYQLLETAQLPIKLLEAFPDARRCRARSKRRPRV